MFIISNISNCIPMGNWHSLDKRKRNEEEEENHKKNEMIGMHQKRAIPTNRQHFQLIINRSDYCILLL